MNKVPLVEAQFIVRDAANQEIWRHCEQLVNINHAAANPVKVPGKGTYRLSVMRVAGDEMQFYFSGYADAEYYAELILTAKKLLDSGIEIKLKWDYNRTKVI